LSIQQKHQNFIMHRVTSIFTPRGDLHRKVRKNRRESICTQPLCRSFTLY